VSRVKRASEILHSAEAVKETAGSTVEPAA